MQVTETLAEGLKHEFQISVPASDLDAKADTRLTVAIAVTAGYAMLLVVLGLGVESLRAYPNFLAFFNTPSGGSTAR